MTHVHEVGLLLERSLKVTTLLIVGFALLQLNEAEGAVPFATVIYPFFVSVSVPIPLSMVKLTLYVPGVL